MICPVIYNAFAAVEHHIGLDTKLNNILCEVLFVEQCMKYYVNIV
jgi:hypothetical protein